MLVTLLVLVWNLLTRRTLGLALLLLSAGLALVSLFVLRDAVEAGLAEFFFSRALYTDRPLGPFINPNFLGVAMAHGAAIALARLFVPDAAPLPRGTRLALAGIVLLTVAGVILSLSRGSMLYLGLAGLLLALQHPRVRGLAVGGGLAVAGLFAVFSVPAWILLRLRVQGGASGREDLWRAGLDMAREHPWFGVGPGNFEPLRNAYLPTETIWFLGDMRGGGSHNALLHRAAEIGFPALVLGALLFAVLLFHVPGALRRYRSGNWLAGFGAAAAVGLVAHAQFEILPTVGAAWPSMNLVFFLAALVLLAGDRAWPAEGRTG
jgi:O-antigen ligase